jgi:hypothetical protein
MVCALGHETVAITGSVCATTTCHSYKGVAQVAQWRRIRDFGNLALLHLAPPLRHPSLQDDFVIVILGHGRCGSLFGRLPCDEEIFLFALIVNARFDFQGVVF